MKPHICCYDQRHLPIVKSSEKSSRTDFGYAEFFIDVCQPSSSRDIFVDPPPDADDDTRASHDFMPDDGLGPTPLEEAFGQHISYAIEIMARQPRMFVYSVYVVGSRARLIRWDRSGCVITESFDIRHHPDILCEFLWRFSQTSTAGRGHDCSVFPVPPDEEDMFKDAITEYVRSQLSEGEDLQKAVSQHYQRSQVFAASILYKDFTACEENIRLFYFSRPVASPFDLVGRATRGYWAVDATTRQVVFLKDTWRHSPVEEVEGGTLRRLLDLGVRHIPSLVWHGDIPYYFPGDRQIDGASSS